MSALGYCWPRCRRSRCCLLLRLRSSCISFSPDRGSPRPLPPLRPCSSAPSASSSRLSAAAVGRSPPHCYQRYPLGRSRLPALSFQKGFLCPVRESRIPDSNPLKRSQHQQTREVTGACVSWYYGKSRAPQNGRGVCQTGTTRVLITGSRQEDFGACCDWVGRAVT